MWAASCAIGKWRRDCAGPQGPGRPPRVPCTQGLASLSFGEGSVEKRFGLIGQILAYPETEAPDRRLLRK